nr:hypothetical protein CFP56_19515 [Quercus suber]
MKIRSIAGTLLDASDQRKGQVAQQAQEYLSAFLKVLVKLERVSPAAHSDPEHPDEDDEEAELRHWADLREYQLKFAQQGGFLDRWTSRWRCYGSPYDGGRMIPPRVPDHRRFGSACR